MHPWPLPVTMGPHQPRNTRLAITPGRQCHAPVGMTTTPSRIVDAQGSRPVGHPWGPVSRRGGCPLFRGPHGLRSLPPVRPARRAPRALDAMVHPDPRGPSPGPGALLFHAGHAGPRICAPASAGRGDHPHSRRSAANGAGASVDRRACRRPPCLLSAAAPAVGRHRPLSPATEQAHRTGQFRHGLPEEDLTRLHHVVELPEDLERQQTEEL